MKTRTLFALLLAGSVMSLVGRAQTVVYTWTGFGQYQDTSYSYNWLNATDPLNDIINTQIVFGDSRNTVVHYYDLYANKLTVSGNTRPYELVGDYDTTHLGAGGVVYAPSGSVTSTLYGRVMLEANQTWNIQGGSLVIDNVIMENVGPFTITKTGAGMLELTDYSSTWTGGLNLNAGTVAIHAVYDSTSEALGTGTLTFNGGTLLTLRDPYDSGSDYVEIENNIVSNGLLSFVNKVDLYLSTNGSTNLTLNADTTVDSHGRPTWIETPIVESTAGLKLTFTGPGWTVIDSSSGYTGGTVVNNGVLIFTTQGTLPALPVSNAFTVGANGYVGFGDDNTEMYNLQTTFIDRFNKAATLGTIGFDTDPSSSYPTMWTNSIDLTGFGSTARLGSATKASLAGTITPQGTDYRFGGGGGWLEVSSTLTGARNLVVDSPAALPLTLHLIGSNDYSGTTTVTNSGVVFGATSQPTGPHTVTINAGGYVGTESANSGDDPPDDADIATFLNTITTTSTGMIGFDGTPSGGRYLSRPIDLSGFTGSLYLGTATTGYTDYGIEPGLILNGTITTTNGGADPYRFAGYKGGLLEVDSTLSGSAGVVIGDPNSPGTFGDYVNQIYSTVYLRGDNSTLTGNVTLYAGELFVGQQNGEQGYDPTSALGTGTLVVQPMTLPTAWTETGSKIFPKLSTAGDIIIANAIQLNTTLAIGETSNSVMFTGKISGSGGLYLENPYYNSSTVLANDTNDFSGGVYLEGYSSLYVETDHALGTGRLAFGNSTSEVYFDSAAPVVYGLQTVTDEDYPSLYATQSNTVLTVNQSFDSTFQGYFYSEAAPDNFRLVKAGSGTLTLSNSGFSMSNGTTEATLPGSPQVIVQVNAGNLVFGSSGVSFTSSTPTIWIHGGTLTFDHFANFSQSNPLVVDNGGRLAGMGGTAGSVTISSTGILSPGVFGNTDVGALRFSNMTLMAGGVLEWNLRNPDEGGGDGWDLVTVSTQLTVDASVAPGTPFTLKLISLGPTGTPGTAVGFLNQPYTWTVFNANSIVFGGGSFNPAAFTLDTSAFNADIGPGVFSFTQSGNQLQLTFTPVPEPSTSVLLAGGLGALRWVIRRRRLA